MAAHRGQGVLQRRRRAVAEAHEAMVAWCTRRDKRKKVEEDATAAGLKRPNVHIYVGQQPAKVSTFLPQKVRGKGKYCAGMHNDTQQCFTLEAEAKQ